MLRAHSRADVTRSQRSDSAGTVQGQLYIETRVRDAAIESGVIFSARKKWSHGAPCDHRRAVDYFSEQVEAIMRTDVTLSR
jgi:hypothetical protein